MVEISPWLSAISALERRISIDNLSLPQYRCLSYVSENKSVKAEDLAHFVMHGTNIEDGEDLIKKLFSRNMLQSDEDTGLIILTELSEMIIDEIYRLCHSRMTRPLFYNPNY